MENTGQNHPWLQELVEQLHGRYRDHQDGDVATYIPELGKADPNNFGICVVTADGRIAETGDSQQTFTIQSTSKPFTYGMALELYGTEKVAQHVGVEPSGDAFNSIELQKNSNRPYNPMINAGAITVTALLYQRFKDEAFDYMLSRFSAAAGRQLSIDESVYQSESRTGHRNRAIAHLLLNFGIIAEDVEPALDLYFKQCAILVNCRDLAVMGATLSNLGKNPLTGFEVFDIDRVKDMLSIMFTCGMYDYSGEWAYKVGVPAKSGVAGGVVAIVNRQLGIASYSPPLDARGNSCRGINVCVDMANELGLHAFDCMNEGSSYLKALL
ncbi:MAG TPA: glutaminase A [Methylotenera sp.]|nr:glutaminase A [Methylotenera sp.]